MYVFYQKPLVLVCAMVYGPRIAYLKRRKEMELKFISLSTFEPNDTEVLSDIIYERLTQEGYSPTSFSFSIDVDFTEDGES